MIKNISNERLHIKNINLVWCDGDGVSPQILTEAPNPAGPASPGSSWDSIINDTFLTDKTGNLLYSCRSHRARKPWQPLESVYCQRKFDIACRTSWRKVTGSWEEFVLTGRDTMRGGRLTRGVDWLSKSLSSYFDLKLLPLWKDVCERWWNLAFTILTA